MLADVADKLQETELAHPVVIIHKYGAIGLIRVKAEELAQLFFDAFLIMAKGLLVEEVPFLGFAGGVTDHAGGTAKQGDGAMAAALEVRQHHDANQVADMQGVSRGVYTQVGAANAFVQHFFCSRHDVVQHAAPFEFFYKIHLQILKSYSKMLLFSKH